MGIGSHDVEADALSPLHVAAASEHEDASFERFYSAEYVRIARVLYGLTGRWALAEELTQEAMLSAHRNWRRVRGLDRPDMWLRRVAINRAISTRRRVTAEVAALIRLPVVSTTEPLDSDDSFVWSHVRKLPRRQAAAIVLWAVEGLTFDEIGEILGCSGETARTHLRRAREQLQTSLRTEEDDGR